MVNRKLSDRDRFVVRVTILLTINPGLFAKLMRLPDSARTDLLEFLGATPVADAQLSEMIETVATNASGERRQARLDAN
jgi:hypothetical protein